MPFATILTMVEVDPKDPAFQNSTKFVDPVYELEEADRLKGEKGVGVHAGRGEMAAGGAFAAGAMLTMLADAMMPEAFEHGGKLVGLMTVIGFLIAAILAVMG